MLWLLGIALAAKPAPAPAPAPAGVVSGAEAAKYVKAVVPQVQAVTTPVRAQLAGTLLELGPAAAEQRRLALCAAARDGETRLAAISPFPADDGLREAGIAWAKAVATECEGDLAKLIALRKPIVSDEDVVTAATMGLAVEQRLRDADAAWFDTVAAFCDRHGVRLTLTKPPSTPEWDSPGLVPPDQDAPPRMVTQLAVGYADQFLGPAKGIADTYESWRSAVVTWKGPAGEAHAASLATLLRAGDALGRLQPFLGDAKLLEAARAYRAEVERILASEGAAITAKSVAGPTSQREIEALNAQLKLCDDQVLAATSQWRAHLMAFSVRWRVAAYQEWLEEALAPR